MLLLRAQDHHTLTAALDDRYRRTDDALGWDAVCAHLTVRRVPGDHVSMIDPPHVDVLAGELCSALAALEATPTRPLRPRATSGRARRPGPAPDDFDPKAPAA